jgi:hypothetical protein
MNWRRTKWNEYINRMEGNSLGREVRDWIPNRRRNLGSPKVKLMDAVKQEDLTDATS